MTAEATAERAAPGPATRVLRRVGEALLRSPRPVAWGLVALQGTLVWALSGIADLGPEGDGVAWSVLGNLAHAPLFGVLALFLTAALLGGRAATWPRLGTRAWLAVLVPVGLWGALDEWHQSRVPGRDASALDFVTDCVGAACVLWIATYLGRPGASESGLWSRLGAGALLCLAAASLSSAL